MTDIHYPSLAGKPVTWPQHGADWHPTLGAAEIRCTICGVLHPSENR